MIKHLFKLIWNKKKQNALLIIEMLFCFMVMFAVFTLLVFSIKNYRQPMGFDYDNVWVVNYSAPTNISTQDSAVLFHETLKRSLLSLPEIKSLSFTSSNVPFSMNTSNSNVSYGKQAELSNIYQTDESYDKALSMNMLEGRWYSKADESTMYTPVVINEQLKETFFGRQTAIGKTLGAELDEKGNGRKFKVVGVVNNVKDKGSYQAIENNIYIKMDSSLYRWGGGSMLVQVTPGTGAAFESRLFKKLSNAIGGNIEIEHLDKKLVSKNRIMLVPLIITAVVGGFLIINVALGLFGVLWYNINKRRGEIGLRRAVGASGKAVSKQLVGEALVLSTISLIIGLFFAIQFPLLKVFDLPANTYLSAIILSVIFIYLLVIICAVYPGKQASTIYPAVALHEE